MRFVSYIRDYKTSLYFLFSHIIDFTIIDYSLIFKIVERARPANCFNNLKDENYEKF